MYRFSDPNSPLDPDGTTADIGAYYFDQIETPIGCTDSYAENYISDAIWDDGSCQYPDNGDFGLSFDGVDNWVEISNDESLSNYDEITISAWIKLEEFLNDRYMIIESIIQMEILFHLDGG